MFHRHTTEDRYVRPAPEFLCVHKNQACRIFTLIELLIVIAIIAILAAACVEQSKRKSTWSFLSQ